MKQFEPLLQTSLFEEEIVRQVLRKEGKATFKGNNEVGQVA